MTSSSLHQEATRLATELEQALDDPSAEASFFLNLVDRYAEVLGTLRETRPDHGATDSSSQAADTAPEAGLMLAFVVTCALMLSVLSIL